MVRGSENICTEALDISGTLKPADTYSDFGDRVGNYCVSFAQKLFYYLNLNDSSCFLSLSPKPKYISISVTRTSTKWLILLYRSLWRYSSKWHLVIQSQQWIHQSNVWNLLKVSLPLTLFWCLCCLLLTDFTHYAGVFIFRWVYITAFRWINQCIFVTNSE